MTGLAAIILLCAQTTSQPPPAPPVATPAAPILSADALALARLLASEEMMLGGDSDRQARRMMAGLGEQHPGLRAMEAQAPGLLKRITEAVLPIANRSMRARLPVLHERLAALYDRSFSPDELASVRGFYASETGTRFIAAMQDGFRADNSVASAAGSGTLMPSGDAVLADLRSAGAEVALSMGDEDQQALARFGETGLLPTLTAVSSDAMQVMLVWAQDYTPGEQEALGRAVADAVKAHLGQVRPRP